MCITIEPNNRLKQQAGFITRRNHAQATIESPFMVNSELSPVELTFCLQAHVRSTSVTQPYHQHEQLTTKISDL